MIRRKLLIVFLPLKRLLLNWIFSVFREMARRLLNRKVRDKTFTIFSNDCYGGEIYKVMGLQYNTPFVGLMLMAPCYIKFLSNPRYYLSTSLVFTSESIYEDLKSFRLARDYYPMALIDDIEIHFLHYVSESEAAEKWYRRSARVNWNRIFVKFCMDKDFATIEHLRTFEVMAFHKVCFSRVNYDRFLSNIQVLGYNKDATVTFKNSLKVFNLVGWLNYGERTFSNTVDRFIGVLLHHLLKR